MNHHCDRVSKMLPFCLIFYLYIFNIVKSDVDTQDIYLNSYKNCGNDIYEVSPKKDYLVQPDVTGEAKTRSFRDCEVTFHSHKEDGHICLMQIGNVGSISDPNAQLEAREGLGDPDDPLIDILKTYPSKWKIREYCTKKSTYITIYLREIVKMKGADIDKVKIQFRVVDIESERREVYFEGNYCDMKYPLLDSQVSLYNRPQFPGMAVSRLPLECGVRFDRIEGSRNTSICFAYLPSEDRVCHHQWRFAVSTADFSLEEEHIKYSLRCNDTRADDVHVWCAEPDVSYVTVIFWRAEGVVSNSSAELAKMFRYIVKDHKGTEKDFLEEVQAMYVTDSDWFSTQWIIYALVGVAVLFGLLIIGILCRRRSRYKPVKNGDQTTSKAV